MGVPEKLADRMAALLLTRAALDIADLAWLHKRSVAEAARVYSEFNERLGLFWLHNCVEDLRVHGRWQAIARSNLREEFYRLRRPLAARILKSRSKKDVGALVLQWLDDNAVDVDHFKQMISEMNVRSDVDFATLSVAAQELRDLVTN